MEMNKNKINILAITLLLLFSMTASAILIPATSAHTPAWKYNTFAFVIASPNPIGVGQSTQIICWLDKIPTGAAASNDIRFHNYHLVITDPDGNTAVDKTWDVVQDTTSSQSYAFSPSKIGVYTIKFDFPGQTYTWTAPLAGFFGPPTPNDNTNDTYSASSASTTLIVQQDPISAIDTYPLPVEYWTRPIFGENPGWWEISSNWLGTGSPQIQSVGSFGSEHAYDGAVGSLTAHIMWTKPLQSGGVVGGTDFSIPGDTYFEGTAYLNRYTNPIIMDGKLFYTEPLGYSGTAAGPVKCVDLRTGQVIWSRTDVPSPSFGYIYAYDDMNYHGVWPPILVATSGGASFFGPAAPLTWRGYDADTGNWLFNITNIPTGTKAMGPQGEYLLYVIANSGTTTAPAYRLLEWNISKCAGPAAMMSNGALVGAIDGSLATCFDYNASIPWRNPLTSFTSVAAFGGDILLCYSGSLPNGGSPASFGAPLSSAPYTYYGINLNASKGPVGSVLWSNTVSAPANNITVFAGGVDAKSGVFVESYKETAQWVGFDLRTGQKLWGPTNSESALSYYGTDFGGVLNGQMAYGNLYSMGFGGIMYCYNARTGQLEWTYGNGGEGNSTNAGLYTGQGTYPTDIYAIGNGVIYTITIEHTFTTPIYKGALFRAINATDGTEIWTLPGVGSGWSYAIADGYSNFWSGYDNQIYVTGRGPSQTTAEAPKAAITLGGSLIISGKVIDISAGTKQNEQAARFPAGVPCASDASMTEWMSYVYQQRPLPIDFQGVNVEVSVIDSNGNYRTIGTAKTDASGVYSLQWTPDIQGKYIVIARFAGNNGYWPSYSETSFAVDSAAPTATPTQPSQQSIADLYFVPAIAGLFVAIIVVGLLIILVLRKRP
jgi:outer membrane protein assembly factor BamB